MMMKRFQIGRVALLSGCAFAGIVAPAHAQSAATAASATPAADAAAPSAQDIIVTFAGAMPAIAQLPITTVRN